MIDDMSEDKNIPTTLQDIADMIEDMKFKHVLVGGVDKADVWRQIEKIDQAYRTLYAFRQEEFTRACFLLEKRNQELTLELIKLNENFSWAYSQLQMMKSELEHREPINLEMKQKEKAQDEVVTEITTK